MQKNKKDVSGDRMLSLKERYTKKEIEDAIVKCNGRWARIVSLLNCSYG
jgi:hypothetical protein